MDTIQKLAERGDKRGNPMYYSWVDVDCHPEVMEWFGLNPFNIPTVVFYNGKHNRFTDMVGSFEFDTIKEQEDKVTAGTLITREAA